MTEPASSAIHDIGFRHYAGPRLGRSWAFRSLAVDTFRGAFGIGRGAKAKVVPIRNQAADVRDARRSVALRVPE